MKGRAIHSMGCWLAGLLPVFLVACASIGTPQGGPKDEAPPVLVGSKPQANATGWKKKKIEIEFDELVNVKNASEVVVVSPPQRRPPKVTAVMRKVVVELQDSLRTDETYTIDFGESIVDYNEGNPYGRYAFAFSTGPDIDTLCLSGHVLEAATLSPLKGIIVGVLPEGPDSDFLQVPFKRIAKTDEKGYFCIRNLKDIPYRVFALGDQNRDYRFDQRGEGIAFLDSSLHLWTEPCQVYDTLWIEPTAEDTVRRVDTVMARTVTCFKPDDVLLRYFNEDFGRQYLAKTERTEANRFSVFFGFKADSLPSVRLLLPDTVAVRPDWYLLEDNATHDSLTYWLLDTLLMRMDTLTLEIRYLKTDSADRLSPWCDTLDIVRKKPKESKNKERQAARANRRKNDSDTTQTKVETVHFKMDAKLGNHIDVYAAPSFLWEAPFEEMPLSAWHLYRKEDTLWVEQSGFEVETDAYVPRLQRLFADWDYGTEYKLEIDSGCVRCCYDSLTNNTYTQTFTVKEESDYATLSLEILGLDGTPAFVDLLDKSEKVVLRQEVVGRKADCYNLKAGDYYVRLVMDANDDFEWTPGDYLLRRQPETVYYLNKKLTLKANWEVNEQWNILQTPPLEQKPKELIKVDKKK